MTAGKAATGEMKWFGASPCQLVPVDPENADARLQDFVDVAREQGLLELAGALETDEKIARFLGAVFDLSPFLRDGARRYPAMVDAIRTGGVEARLAELTRAIERVGEGGDVTETGLMDALRRMKGEAHALIAIDDLAQNGQAPVTVRRLSLLADACVGATIRWLLRDAAAAGKLAISDLTDPEKGSGWIILAMGKLGANELNFSSDIDLIVFFDPDAPAIADPDEAADLFVRLTRRMIRILQERTSHGYVFRTDLRLRPDPGSTPLAIPVEAALHYYEGRGQNWERAAMIKARAIAGDKQAGEMFLNELTPYIWRKYMDYAAIADVHSIKRQIHAHKGHGAITVKGHNVKLGRGGIREIEFFVQTQQLIAGGRFPELRGRKTIAMLDQLAAHNWISGKTRDAMETKYWFLRNVEHAIQMVADEQIHTLPEDEEGLTRIAHMLGFSSRDQFSEAFIRALTDVERHYAALFETAPQLSGELGNLVFSGEADDPDTLKTLAGLGFERPADMSRIIRGWHYGRYRAIQSARARQRLTELVPALLAAFSQTQRADEALLRFDEFLSGLPAGIQLFSLLQSNPALLELLAMIMGTAPRLAAIITRRPHVFDGLLDPALMAELPTKQYLAERLRAFLDGTTLHEETLDRLRIFAAEQKFLIGVRLLTGAIDAERAGKAFSDLADLTISAALQAVLTEFAAHHGTIGGGKVVILGMGKLGSRELTAGSDVDLILLYDHDPGAEQSDGEKSLATSLYFTRLTQRLISAVSAPTAEGVLYELDLRLRPSGNKGPVATHIEAFSKYQSSQAWTWEHMALTRARVVSGDGELAAKVERTIAAVLEAPCDRGKVIEDAAQMRAAIEREKPPRDLWDLKLVPGGLVDLEFIAQIASLTNAVEPAKDAQQSTSTGHILARLSADFADEQTREDLLRASRLYTTMTQILQVCLTAPLDRENTPPGLTDILCRSTDLPDFSVLEAHIEETSRTVRNHFDRLFRGRE